MKYKGRKVPEGLRQVIRLNAFNQFNNKQTARGFGGFNRRGKHALGKLTRNQLIELKHLKRFIAEFKHRKSPTQNGVVVASDEGVLTSGPSQGGGR